MNKKYKTLLIFFVCLSVGGLSAFLIVQISSRTETLTHYEQAKTSTSILTCTNAKPDNVFFTSDNANNSLHKVKILYKEGIVSSISYTYTGQYPNIDIAKLEHAKFNANYNIYMSDNGLNPDSLTPTFSSMESEATINLYSNVNNINSSTAKFFFLDDIEYPNIEEYQIETLEKIYTNKKFNCKST